jgi:hypothetical protein
MFYGEVASNQNIGPWKVGSVTEMVVCFMVQWPLTKTLVLGFLECCQSDTPVCHVLCAIAFDQNISSCQSDTHVCHVLCCNGL